MAFDGLFCRALASELQTLNGARADKIHQNGASTVEITFYKDKSRPTLELSALPASPFAVLKEDAGEHSQSPTTFCLLLRKHFLSAKVASVSALENERVLCFAFDAPDELGHIERKYLYAELMGKYSNLIAATGTRVLGALHTSDATASRRQLMVGFPYELPPKQDKLSAFSVTPAEFAALAKLAPDRRADRFLLETFLAFSPLVCREIVHEAGGKPDSTVIENDLSRLSDSFFAVLQRFETDSYTPTAVFSAEGKPVEFSFEPIAQYGPDYTVRQYDTFSALLTDYYGARKVNALVNTQTADLFRLLSARRAHLEKKRAAQSEDLSECSKKDACKRNGDLLTGNLYRVKQGMKTAECMDYETGETVSVPLDTRLTPAVNAQRYYKKYAKYKNAEQVLTTQIAEADAELAYLDTVSDALGRCENEREIDEIRAELASGGYLRVVGKYQYQKLRQKPLKPREFTTADGLTVRVGRNNVQNDALTKSAEKNELWFHIKHAAGSHVILTPGAGEPTDRDYTCAAMLAAYFSSARGASRVEVDYTRVRNVKKPAGAKPGLVTYEKYFTAVVDAVLPEELKDVQK